MDTQICPILKFTDLKPIRKPILNSVLIHTGFATFTE